MEITSFVLGMLTMVAAIIVTAIVLGIVKISKLTKEQDSLHQLCAAIEGDLRRIIEDTNRDITMVERTIMNRIEKVDTEHHKHEEEIHREINETRRYIDSRIDKVVVKGTLESSKKQVING